MHIAVISDLHLGPRGPADDFGHEDAEFLRFLTFLESNFEKIVLLGDIWETLTARLPGDPGRELRRVQDAHREIAARFRLPKYAYVHGNHDIVAGAVDATPDELVVEADGMRLLFMHGHQGDALIQKRRWLSELGVWLGGFIRRLGAAPLYRLFQQLDTLRAVHDANEGVSPFQRWAAAVAGARRADVMVTGHTHRAVCEEHGSRLFMNSGSCSEGRLQFLSIDTRRGDFRVNAQ